MITNAVTLEQGVTVTQLKGQIYLVAADGSRKLLAEGDVLPKGAVIMSPDGASFMGGGQSFNVQPASEQSEPAEEGDAPQLAQNGAAGTPDDINALQQAILGGADPTQAFEASAAGGAPAAGGGGIGGVAGASGNGGFVTIDRTGSATIAEATFDTTYNANGELPLGAAGEDEVFDLTPPTISVFAPDNTNDTTPTLTGTTDAPVGSTVTLLVIDANGNQQTLTAIVTPSGTFTVDVVTPLAEGSYTVTATVTDPAGNTGTATDNGSVDVTAPTITVDAPDNTTDTTPNITGTTNAAPGSTVTLVVTDANGTQQTLTATVQPSGSYSVDVTTPLAEGSYKVDASVTDPAGNTDTATDNGSVDVTAPVITVDAPDNTNDTTPTITGTTDAPVGSTVTLVVTDANGNQQTLTATVQPGGGYSVDVTTPLAEGSYKVDASVTDPAGNTGSATDNGSVDTVAPELGIDLDPIVVGDDNTVNKAEADDKASVTLNGTVSGDAKVGDTITLTLGDGSKLTTQVVVLGNGQLGFSTSTTADKLVGGSSINAEITVTDAAGNSTTKSDSEEYSLDTAAPSVVVDIVDDKLTVGETSSVTFTFSEKVKDFDVGDLTVEGGTVTDLKTTDGGKTWTGTFTPTPGFEGTASVTVNNGSYTDLNGNVGTGGSDTAPVDTAAPSVVVDIVDDKLTVGETSSVTFTFSEKVKGFEVGDLTVVGGTVTDLKTTDGGKTWTGTFTPTPGFEGTASVTVNNGSYTDLNGNVGTGGSDTAPVDTAAPSVVVDIVDDKLTVGETSSVTFTFSEKVKGFEVGDLTVVGGTVTDLKTTDGGKTWTGTFTPTPGFEGTASVTVNNGSYT
ncbi:retention module-containing protein, partial [Aeromonas veronii]|uniref:retention module-containing protein n=3 Tax=Aeromonas veronii TaxID=654 RepID=UPI00191F4F8B